jgi:hypothetical protein
MKPLLRDIDKPLYGRTLVRVDISDRRYCDPDDPRPFHVRLTFDIGAGVEFNYRTEAAARRAWRKLVGL